jgi:hypothetical protein
MRHSKPKWVEDDGLIRDYCGMSCAISAGALTFPPTFDKCLEFKDDQKLVEDDGHIRDYCGKRCARKEEREEKDIPLKVYF